MSRAPVRLRALILLLWSRRGVLVATAVVFAMAAALYAVTREPVYESDALLAPVKDEGLQIGGGMGGLLGQVAGIAGLGAALGGANLDESQAVVLSREFSLRFMRAHGVDRYLFPKLWDARANAWKPRPPRSGPLVWLDRLGLPVQFDRGTDTQAPGPPADQLILRFDKIRTAVIDRRTDFIRLSVRGPSPEIARDWARAMIQELNESIRSRVLGDSRRAVDLLSRKVETDPLQSVRVAASAILEAQLRREVMTESRAEYAVRMLDAPSLPVDRYYPKRSRMALLGALAGLLLASVYVIGESAWSRRRVGAAPAHPSAGARN